MLNPNTQSHLPEEMDDKLRRLFVLGDAQANINLQIQKALAEQRQESGMPEPESSPYPRGPEQNHITNYYENADTNVIDINTVRHNIASSYGNPDVSNPALHAERPTTLVIGDDGEMDYIEYDKTA